MEVSINYLAVLAAGVASMIVGFLCYGVLFKKQYMSLMGFTPESMKNMKMTANKAYLIQFIASLVMACVLSSLITLMEFYLPDVSALRIGVDTGFWVWLGFVVPVSLGVVLWEGKPWTLWFLNASNYLVTLVVMGIVLSLWV